MSKVRRVFVYGTLMRGERAHHLLRPCTFLHETATEPAFELVDLGAFPGLVDGGTRPVRGEVYAVPAHLLSVLDEYEDVPEVYERRAIRTELGDTEAYVLRPRYAAARPRIASGDWRRRRARAGPGR